MPAKHAYILGRLTPVVEVQKPVVTPRSPLLRPQPVRGQPPAALGRSRTSPQPGLTPQPGPPAVPPRAASSGPPPPSRQQRRALFALLARIQVRWPQVFPTRPQAIRPLVSGLHRALAPHFPEHTLTFIRAALRLWHKRWHGAYLQALARGGPRYDLEGRPRGAVSPAEQQQAKAALARMVSRPAGHRRDQRTGMMSEGL